MSGRGPRRVPDAVTSLAPILHDLLRSRGRLELPPESRHAADVTLGTGNDIVERDDSSRAHQRRVDLVVGFHAAVGMVAVKEQELDGPSSEQRGYALRGRRRVRVCSEQNNLLTRARKRPV